MVEAGAYEFAGGGGWVGVCTFVCVGWVGGWGMWPDSRCCLGAWARRSLSAAHPLLPPSPLFYAETQSFLDAAASLAGPYQWGIYDILLLPPSFPYGGMENPCLT